jgi:hypothetical protein
MNVKWNPDALNQVVQKAFQGRVEDVQRVLDSLLATEKGKDVATVKATLAARWQSEFGITPSDEFLQPVAEKLAAGARVVLKPGEVPRLDL